MFKKLMCSLKLFKYLTNAANVDGTSLATLAL